MSALTELGLITKPALCELVTECSYFLVHPNLWVRQAIAGFISSAAKTLSILDVQCKLVPKLKIYMKYPLIQVDKYEFINIQCYSKVPPPSYILNGYASQSIVGYNLRTCWHAFIRSYWLQNRSVAS